MQQWRNSSMPLCCDSVMKPSFEEDSPNEFIKTIIPCYNEIRRFEGGMSSDGSEYRTTSTRRRLAARDRLRAERWAGHDPCVYYGSQRGRAWALAAGCAGRSACRWNLYGARRLPFGTDGEASTRQAHCNRAL